MPHCSAAKRDGSKCTAWAVHGFTECVWHLEQHIKREIRERVLGKGEQATIVSKQIKSLQRAKLPPLEKAKEIRGLVQLLREIQGGKPPDDDNGKVDPSNPLEAKLEKWRKTQT